MTAREHRGAALHELGTGPFQFDASGAPHFGSPDSPLLAEAGPWASATAWDAWDALDMFGAHSHAHPPDLCAEAGCPFDIPFSDVTKPLDPHREVIGIPLRPLPSSSLEAGANLVPPPPYTSRTTTAAQAPCVPVPMLAPLAPLMPPKTSTSAIMLDAWRCQNPAWFAELRGVMKRMPPVPNNTSPVSHVSLVVHIPTCDGHVRLLTDSVYVNTVPELPRCRLCGITGYAVPLATGLCGHVLCAECWEGVLNHKLACPVCSMASTCAVRLDL